MWGGGGGRLYQNMQAKTNINGVGDATIFVTVIKRNRGHDEATYDIFLFLRLQEGVPNPRLARINQSKGK